MKTTVGVITLIQRAEKLKIPILNGRNLALKVHDKVPNKVLSKDRLKMFEEIRSGNRRKL